MQNPRARVQARAVPPGVQATAPHLADLATRYRQMQREAAIDLMQGRCPDAAARISQALLLFQVSLHTSCFPVPCAVYLDPVGQNQCLGLGRLSGSVG